MYGKVIAGDLIVYESDIGKYYLYKGSYGELYIRRNGFFTSYERLISKQKVRDFTTVFTEINYDSNDHLYLTYFVSILFKDDLNILLECDSDALKAITINLY